MRSAPIPALIDSFLNEAASPDFIQDMRRGGVCDKAEARVPRAETNSGILFFGIYRFR